MYFFYDEFINIFFELCIDNKIFLFNKPLNEFYDKKIFTKLGKFQMSYDKLSLLYSSMMSNVHLLSPFTLLSLLYAMFTYNNIRNQHIIIIIS